MDLFQEYLENCRGRKGGIPILTSFVFSSAGKYHQDNNRPNEDCIVMKKSGNVSVIVACDGAGSMNGGKEAAMLISDLLTNELASNFKSLYFSEPEVAKRHTIQAVEMCLITFAHDNKMDASELACTIVAAAMDDAGRCICFHLGDGMILRRRVGNNNWDIVSSPRNGIIPNSTYLTMNCSLLTNLQFYRWKDPAMEQLLLLTDGAADLFKKQDINGSLQENNYSRICDYLQACDPYDDFSFGIFTRKME